MKTIKIDGKKSYDIFLGEGILSRLGEKLVEKGKSGRVCVVTDDIVDKLHFDKVAQALCESGFEVVKYVVENGEKSKTLKSFGDILSFLAQNDITRKDTLIALGGGVVGDLCGFGASAYLRGVDFVQVPTTLLAQIDSSVGAKTAVDLPEGKNLVGAFYEPLFVLIDTLTLKTLPRQILVDGLGEMSKYALLIGGEFCQLVEKNELEKNLPRLIEMSIIYKKKVVEIDEHEQNERRLLNLGHTPCHAIEKLSGYTISHGKGVGMGLYIIIDACKKAKMLSEEEFLRAKNILKLLFQEEFCPFEKSELIGEFKMDKKREGEKITLVLLEGIGKPKLVKMSLNEAKEFIL